MQKAKGEKKKNIRQKEINPFPPAGARKIFLANEKITLPITTHTFLLGHILGQTSSLVTFQVTYGFVFSRRFQRT